MSLIMWGDWFAVGIPKIDEQHKLLLNMINDLSTVVSNEQKQVVVPSIISRLIDYSKEHFAYEESLMDTVPEDHRQLQTEEHNAFIAKVDDYVGACSSGYVPYGDMVEFLSGWLVNHIAEVDMELGRYLAA
ncbi:MAG: hemerythrin family protein [Desulfovibrionaceae bacterium]|nr:hemerythrin family protein [Desulfovibrionaceae bacterium]MBF0514259.1 hemerythrin family protein [Desulfovibrionaceae bacterium]